MYATTGYLQGYGDEITINFAPGVNGVSFVVTNNTAGSFWVSDNVGDYYSGALDENSSGTFTLGGAGMTYVTISEQAADNNLFDFAIDDVQSNVGGTTGFSTGAVGADAPEPSSVAMLLTGLGGVASAVRRRRLR